VAARMTPTCFGHLKTIEIHFNQHFLYIKCLKTQFEDFILI
jgi:hypothetical protein